MAALMRQPPPFSLSQRSHFGDESDEFAELERSARAHADPINLSRSNPTTLGLELPEWSESLQGKNLSSYRPESAGLSEARVQLASSLSGRAAVEKEQLFLTSSTSEAYFQILLTLTDPGDSLLVPEPSYPLFDHFARLAGVRLRRYQIVYDGAFHLDLSSLPSREEVATQRIRAAVIVSPNNPTGNTLRVEELQALRALGLPLIVDEVFRPFIHSKRAESEFADPLGDAADHDLTLLLDGFSKRACAPGLKLAWVVAAGRREQTFRSRFEHVLDTFLSPSTAAQLCLPAVLAKEAGIQKRVMSRISENRRFLLEQLSTSAASPLMPDGGWSCILRLPATENEDSWIKRLAHVGLVAQGGQLYSLPFDASIVLSLLVEEAPFRRGIKRLFALVEAATS